MKKKLLLIPIISLLLSGCSLEDLMHWENNDNAPKDQEKDDEQDEETPSEQGENPYVVKKVNIYRNKDAIDKQISLRFYDELPNVPYISVDAYFKEFFSTTLTRFFVGDQIQYKNGFNDYIQFDVEGNKFSSNNLETFNNHPDFIENNSKLFIKFSKEETSQSVVRTIDMNKYSIPFFNGDGKAYVPLSFLSSISGGVQQYNIAYNGKDIYVFDWAGQLGTSTPPSYFSSLYFDELHDLSKTRQQDVIDYSYNELCFIFDNLRGYTKQLYMGDDNLLQLGLDGVLSRDYPKIKEYLLSKNKEEFYEGYSSLFNALYDGGHTVIPAAGSFGALISAVVRNSEEEFNTISSEVSALSKRKTSTFTSFWLSKSEFASKSLKKYYLYKDEYKTAYIGFDSFDVDYEGWDNFYNKKGYIPVETDTYAYVRDKMYKAKEDGAKNVVLDLTTNGGGSSYALEGLLGLFNKSQAYIRMEDTFNQSIITDHHQIDINLDGKWDLLDEKETEQFDFNVGVLTSSYAFSCGNLFPFNMKELGYKIIGEKTGGGSCAISTEVTAEGLPFVHSSYLCLVDKDGENIDGGVDVDFAIERAPISSLLDNCDSFFDFARVSEYLTSAYN